VVHTYTLDGNDEQWTLTFDADLPATTVVTVTVSTAAQNQSGDPLANESSFDFTTGAAADDTPPNLLGIEPAGPSIPADTSFLRLTFDEPVDNDSLEPSEVSGALMFSMEDAENAGVWSDNHTVFTVALNTPLAAGGIFHVRFESFADFHGNVNTTPFEWTATVAGTPDFMPVVDQLMMGYMGTWSEDPFKQGGELWRVTKYEVLTGGEFKRWESEEYGFGPPPAKDFDFMDFELFKLTASQIQYLGFYEADGGGDKDPFEVNFDPPIEWIRIPMPTAGYFIEGTSFFDPVPAEGPDRVDYDVTFEQTVYDIDSPFGDKQGGPPLVWLGCRKAIVNYEVKDADMTYSTGTDQIWFCPGVGPVRMHSVSNESGGTYTTAVDLGQIGFEE